MDSNPGDAAAKGGKYRTWQLVISATLQLFCFTVSFLAAATVIIYNFAAVLPDWTWRYDADDTWETFRTVAASYKYTLTDAGDYLFAGWDAVQLIMITAMSGFAMVMAAFPLLFLNRGLRKAAWEWRPMDLLRRFYYRVERWGSTPMYPHRFWLWWSNGLSAADALLWVLFCVGHAVGIQQLSLYYQNIYWPPWDEAGLEYPIPKSVDNLRWVSLAASWVLYMDFVIILFPICHISFLHTILGTTWAAIVKYHRWIGHFGLWTTTLHGVLYYYYWMCNPYLNFWHEFFDWNTTSTINNLAGSLSWLFGVALWVTSVDWIRRNYFQVFYATHIIGFMGFILFMQMHYYWSITYVAAGLGVYMLDIAYRAIQGQNVSQVSNIAVAPDGTLAKIDLPIDPSLAAKMRAGQDVFLQFPSFSRWAWHPFTVYKVNGSSEPGVVPSMTVVVKKYSRWTKRLMAELIHSVDTGAAVPVKMVGPVGGIHGIRPTTKGVVMLVGGVGASPALALLHDMLYKGQCVPTTLVFTARSAQEFTVLDETVLHEGVSSWLDLKLFHTGDRIVTCSTCAKEVDGLEKQRSTSIGSSSGDHDHDDHAIPKATKPAHTSASGAWLKTAAPVDQTAAPLSRTSQRWFSAYGWNTPRPLQSRAGNKWNMFATLLLMWMGVYMGLVQGQSAMYERWYIVWPNEGGWMLGCIYLLTVCVQAAGLPALYLYFVQWYQWFKSRPGKHSLYSVATDTVPQCQIMGRTKIGLPESNLSVEMQRGRPNIRAILEQAQERTPGSGEDEVAVVVAGPRAMCNSAEQIAWELNHSRTSNKPFLRVVRETYEL